VIQALQFPELKSSKDVVTRSVFKSKLPPIVKFTSNRRKSVCENTTSYKLSSAFICKVKLFGLQWASEDVSLDLFPPVSFIFSAEEGIKYFGVE
jgi:hypothetical protein